MQPVDSIGALSPWVPGIFSLGVYALVVSALVGLLLAASSFIGKRKPTVEKLRPYESGIIPTGTARLKYPVPFYLVAIFFLIFDVEGAFIFSWAIAARELGWAGWLQIAFFIVVLLLGLVYIWEKGGLEWGPTLKTDRTTGS
ncbi:MAG: NADH-quinone oxidoreductase subunit A [Desulfobacterales bacterium]|jgi:NADH-quinone oxidoreductase subunit A